MKSAFLRDDRFLADVREAASGGGVLHLWWLGQSGFLVQHDGRFLLLDPYLSDSLTRKYAGTDLPHVRMMERVVEPDRLGFVSAVCCSHLHTDHLDGDTIRPMIAANPSLRIVIPEAIRADASKRLQVEPARLIGMDDHVSREIEGFVVHAVPSAHNELETDAAGRHRCLGYVVHAGRWRVYHSGDTRPYDGLAGRLRAFDLDVGLLPINGWSPERRVPGNLDAREAAALGMEARMRLVVPHHFDMFEFNTADPQTFLAEAKALGLPARVLRPGERLTLGG
jgi:L-ascorbate metabolism protein UlaG (beta-lactamase superfamily)